MVGFFIDLGMIFEGFGIVLASTFNEIPDFGKNGENHPNSGIFQPSPSFTFSNQNPFQKEIVFWHISWVLFSWILRWLSAKFLDAGSPLRPSCVQHGNQIRLSGAKSLQKVTSALNFWLSWNRPAAKCPSEALLFTMW